MRKLCLFGVIAVMLLMAGFVLADEREVPSSTAKTTFGNVAVGGNNVTGVPGYIEFWDISTTSARYYLWVGSDGKLRISSEAIVGYGASPTDVYTWTNASGTVVGNQR